MYEKTLLGPAIFVAKTTLSRLFFNHVPINLSVLPCVYFLPGTEYISAVSIKFTPLETA
jgi:hypothetical protein